MPIRGLQATRLSLETDLGDYENNKSITKVILFSTLGYKQNPLVTVKCIQYKHKHEMWVIVIK